MQEKPDLDPSDPMYRTFSKIFDAFKITDEEEEQRRREEEAEAERRAKAGALSKVPKHILEDEEDEDGEGKQKDDDDEADEVMNAAVR